MYILYININKQVYLGIMKKCQTKEHHDNDKKIYYSKRSGDETTMSNYVKLKSYELLTVMKTSCWKYCSSKF